MVPRVQFEEILAFHLKKTYPMLWHVKATMFYGYLNVSQPGATRTKQGVFSKGRELHQERKTFFLVLRPPTYLRMCKPPRRMDAWMDTGAPRDHTVTCVLPLDIYL